MGLRKCSRTQNKDSYKVGSSIKGTAEEGLTGVQMVKGNNFVTHS